MTRKQILIFLLIVMTVALTSYVYSQFTRKNKDLAVTRPDVRITSADLIRSFEMNERLANEKYLDKIVAVTGKVTEINKDEKGYYTLVLGDENAMSSVRCSMDTTHACDLAPIKTGSQITIKAACTGFNADELLGSDVILNRGVVVSKN